MLEQIRNRTQTTFAKVILGIIIVPFALFGIDSYLSSVGNVIHIASVNNEHITAKALQDAENRFKARQEESTDPKLFESIEFKKAILEGLIAEKLINQEIKNSGFHISNSQIATYISGMPEFKKKWKIFSRTIR